MHSFTYFDLERVDGRDEYRCTFIVSGPAIRDSHRLRPLRNFDRFVRRTIAAYLGVDEPPEFPAPDPIQRHQSPSLPEPPR